MPSKTEKPKALLRVIGWREWVKLPDFGIGSIKVKVDTGARTSSLHGYDPEEFVRRGQKMIRFGVHPEQRRAFPTFTVEAPLVEYRKVKPSSGRAELRPVVLTTVELMGEVWDVELTLTCRDEMGFRMLLGRQAIRRKFLVDSSKSYLSGKRPRSASPMKDRKRSKR